MLKYTKIGENNKLIRRMRTVFDTEDQSMMARFENQKALNAYMDEMPFGIGMGAIDGVVPPHNKYYFVSICPSDSSLVDVWKQMGIVGLCVFWVCMPFYFYRAPTSFYSKSEIRKSGDR